MATHIEMKALAGNAAAVTSLAGYLASLSDGGWTDWEVNFLDSMARHRGPDPITMRQREVLIELRDSVKSFARVDGMRVARLVQDCWCARLDLEEDDALFIERLHAAASPSLKRRPLLRLLGCARQLNLVTGYIAID